VTRKGQNEVCNLNFYRNAWVKATKMYVRCRLGFDLSSNLAKFINLNTMLILLSSSCVKIWIVHVTT
jgi:hypothetical protein